MAKTMARAGGKNQPISGEIVRLTHRWTMTLPKKLRQGLSPDQIFEVERREDGVIELRPRVLTDPSQAWFWSAKWQQMEREADEDIAAGRVKRFDTMEELIADLDSTTPE